MADPSLAHDDSSEIISDNFEHSNMAQKDSNEPLSVQHNFVELRVADVDIPEAGKRHEYKHPEP